MSERHDILMVDVATGAERRLTTEIADEDQPTWSPDGRRIAYVADPSGNADIYVRDVSLATPNARTSHCQALGSWELAVGSWRIVRTTAS